MLAGVIAAIAVVMAGAATPAAGQEPVVGGSSPTASIIPPEEPLALVENYRWVAVASRQNLDEAISIARVYSQHRSRVVRAQNGWYAVVLGPYETRSIISFRRNYSGPRLPADAMLTRGTGYAETVWRPQAVESAKESTAASIAERPTQGLTANEINALRLRLSECWNTDVAPAEPSELRVKVKIYLNHNGTLSRLPVVLEAGSGTVALAATASAIRAVRLCAPYKLPPEKYPIWRVINVTFDPKDMINPARHLEIGSAQPSTVPAPMSANKSAECRFLMASRPELTIEACTTIIISGTKSLADLAVAYFNRGLAHAVMGENDVAISDFDNVIEINPDYALAYLNRGRAHRAKADLKKALFDFKAAVRLLPEGNPSGDDALAQIAEIEKLVRPPTPPSASAKPTPPPAPPPVASMPPPSEQVDAPIYTGTGIIVSAEGGVLTNNHVIDECRKIEIRRGSDLPIPARVLHADPANDLALLKIDALLEESEIAAIRIAPRIRNGEDIAVYGFPMVGTLSSSGNITRGNVSALAGLGDDVRLLQVTAPIQNGNSGGPLLDQSANVIGVVNMKLDEIKLVQESGEFPQNVNFAIRASVAASCQARLSTEA